METSLSMLSIYATGQIHLKTKKLILTLFGKYLYALNWKKEGED